MTDYDEDVAINQLRHAVLLTGRMDEQKNAYNMRESAKNRLADWFAERIDYEILNKLCGNASATFGNTPTAAAATRSVWAGGQSATASVTTAMKMDTKVLDAAKQMALLASPRVRPLRINGKEYFVAILHPYSATNLRQDPVWNQAPREANVRGEENPIKEDSQMTSGNYIVTKCRHVLTFNEKAEYMQGLEIVKDGIAGLPIVHI
jgi:N4-gp56 family major capsid protein